MDRWITVKFLELHNVTLYEQALFIAKGLRVYNKKGLRVIEASYDDDIPYGCVPFTSDYDQYAVGDITYYRWLEAPDKLREFMFMTRELVDFLLRERDKPKINDIINSLPHELFENDTINYKQHITNLQDKIHELQLKNEILTNIINDTDTSSITSKVEQATLARQTTARKNWAFTLQKAVSLAVTCARSGKPKSTKQHKDMWRLLWEGESSSLPRSEGFEAFRRGLPDDLKGNS